MSSSTGQKTYYRKAKDAHVWEAFERTAARLGLSMSEALVRAVGEWAKEHAHDDPDSVHPERKRPQKDVVDHDPFEVFKDAPRVKIADPFKS